jgi:hypothetical protein
MTTSARTSLFVMGFIFALSVHDAYAQFRTWEVSFTPGVTDVGDHLMNATELRDLVTWDEYTDKATLNAGLGCWMDQASPRCDASVITLDKSGKWRELVNFGDFCPKETPRCALATSVLTGLHFVRDKGGDSVNVWVMTASTWDTRNPPWTNVYARNNSDLKFYETKLDTSAHVRSMGTHLDKEAGKDWAFAGSNKGTIYRGQLSDTRGAGKNIIEWETGPANAELTAPYVGPPCDEDRVMAFAEAEGKLYASRCWVIIQRIDGAQGECRADEVKATGSGGGCQQRWQVIWSDPHAGGGESGLRGMTMVVVDGRDQLLVGEERVGARIWRVDPAHPDRAQVEADMSDMLENHWGEDVGYVIPSYTTMPLWTDATGRGRRIIGTEAFLPSAKPSLPTTSIALQEAKLLNGVATYFLRDAPASYRVFQIPPITPQPMVAVRAAAPSPFATDCDAQHRNCAVFFGGYDANAGKTLAACLAPPCTSPPLIPASTHNTAWIVKGKP